jgi:hypothetical protein
VKTVIRFALFLFILMAAACGIDPVSSGGGTVVSNPPSVSTTSVSPDFDSNVPETATLGENTAATDESAGLAMLTTGADSAYLDGPAGFWAEIFLNGPVARFRQLRTHFYLMGTRIASAVSEDGSFQLSETPRTFNIGSRAFFDTTRNWTVSVSLRNDTFVKAVFSDSDTGQIGAYYLFETDSDGTPVSGAFAYVNPDTLSAAAAPDLVRFLAITFDFNDPSQNELSSTLDAYDSLADRYVVHHMEYECDETSGTCLGEFLRIDTPPPSREFSARLVRIQWNEETREICLAPASYSESSATIGQTQSFVGPDVPGESDVETGVCEINEPFWASRVFSPADFPKRFDDDSDGGFASQLFGDGTSVSAWDDAIGADTIDDWLLGIF